MHSNRTQESSVIKSRASLLNCDLKTAIQESKTGMLVNGKEFGYVNISKWHIDFPKNGSIGKLSDAREVKVIEDDKLQQEPSPLSSKLKSKMKTSYSRHLIDLNKPYMPQVDECMGISPLEASNRICACENLAKPSEVRRVGETKEEEEIMYCGSCKLDVEYLSTKTISVYMPQKDDYNMNDILESREVLPSRGKEEKIHESQANLQSVDKKQLSKLEMIREDSHNPSLHTPVDFQAIDNGKNTGNCLEEEQFKVYKRSFSKKQKFRQNYQEKRYAEEKRDKNKEIRGKNVSTSLKVSSAVQQQKPCFTCNS